MVTIIHLPPQEIPKRLTAKHQSHNLEEHLKTFMAKHNPKGYLKEDTQFELTELVELMIEINTRQLMSNTMFSKKARDIKQLTNGAFRHCQALDLISRIFGYRSYQDGFWLRDENNCILNLRKDSVDVHLVFNTDEEYLQSLKVYTGPRDQETSKTVGFISTEYRSRSWSGIETRDLYKIITQFVREFQVGNLRTDKEPLRALAAKRFFGLNDYHDLKKYIRRAEFPPLFNPVNLERNEVTLSKILSKEIRLDQTFGLIYQNLSQYCESEIVRQQLSIELFEMTKGIDGCFIDYWSKGLGACGVLIAPLESQRKFKTFGDMRNTKKAIAFITENNKIVQIIRLTERNRDEKDLGSTV